jgi:energy-coupling factor transport system substrate-specific component
MTDSVLNPIADPRQPAVGLKIRSTTILLVVSLIGFAMFAWPFILPAQPSLTQHAGDAPILFTIILPLLLALAWTGLTDGRIDVKALGLLGVLAAVNAALRPLGAGVAGLETMSFLLIVAGRVFGPGFGFALGCVSMVSSALLTAGVGPWLPFQMLAAGWIGLGAGLLPDRWRGRPIRGWPEILLLSLYGVISAYLFGLLMNMWFWPYVLGQSMGDQAGLAYIPGGPLVENLHRFLIYSLVTSTVVWDTGRAITDVVGLTVLGPAVLTILRRAARRAQFDPIVEFDDRPNKSME